MKSCDYLLHAGCAVWHLSRDGSWDGHLLPAPGMANEACGQVQEPSTWHQAEEDPQVRMH